MGGFMPRIFKGKSDSLRGNTCISLTQRGAQKADSGDGDSRLHLLLETIRTHEPCMVSELARYTNIDEDNLKEVQIPRLVGMGLVKIESPA